MISPRTRPGGLRGRLRGCGRAVGQHRALRVVRSRRLRRGFRKRFRRVQLFGLRASRGLLVQLEQPGARALCPAAVSTVEPLPAPADRALEQLGPAPASTPAPHHRLHAGTSRVGARARGVEPKEPLSVEPGDRGHRREVPLDCGADSRPVARADALVRPRRALAVPVGDALSGADYRHRTASMRRRSGPGLVPSARPSCFGFCTP